MVCLILLMKQKWLSNCSRETSCRSNVQKVNHPIWQAVVVMIAELPTQTENEIEEPLKDGTPVKVLPLGLVLADVG